MRVAQVFWNDELAGRLTEIDSTTYEFEYSDSWFTDESKPPVSLTLPKNQKRYRSHCLFPFFFNMLSEGANRNLQSRLLRIDEKDHFGLLLATASKDNVGPVKVVPMNFKAE